MYNFSRKIVTFFIIVFTQSSLGTNAVLLSSQNLGQNGYRKYEDGLLIQWGNNNNANSLKTIFLSISFKDKNYKVISAGILSYTSDQVVLSPSVYSKDIGSFTILGKYAGDDGTHSGTYYFDWIAIGRWK